MSAEELRRVEVLARVRSAAVAGGRREPAAGRELPASQAVMEALPRGRACGSEAPQRGASFQPGLSVRISAAGADRGAGEVRRWSGGAVRADAGSRAPGIGRRAVRECRDAATLDAAGGLWSRERKRRKHRQRRERKEHFGELVQMDGSFHAWLEERGPEGCLIDLADDATNRPGRSWGSRRRFGRWPMRCAAGSNSTECRWRCMWTGRICTSERPRRANGCVEKSRSRSLGACARSWGSS